MNSPFVGPCLIENTPPPRCRVGDRCLIVGGDEQANLGRSVRVIEKSTYPWTPMWLVRSEGGAGLMGHYQSRHGLFDEVAYADVFLLPIRPDAIDEGEPTTVKRKRGRPEKVLVLVRAQT